VQVGGLLHPCSRISCPSSSLDPVCSSSSKETPSMMRARGQSGLLGGSSRQDKPNATPKSSKLAKLAQSSRGAFEKKAILRQKQDSSSFESVSRLAALSLGSRPPNPSTAVKSETIPEARSQPSAADSIPRVEDESEDLKASTDLRADHLLAEPSMLADSLFRLWIVPKNAADSLSRIYADPYLLTVSDQSQLQNAFSTSSPDDVVQRAQLRGKRNSGVLVSL
jgi:hypothetical protein